MKTLAKLIGMWLAVFLAGKLAFMAVCHGAETLTLRIVIGFALVFIAIIVSEVLPQRGK